MDKHNKNFTFDWGARKKDQKLEKNNFKISTKWRSDIDWVLTNPEWDVREKDWEQLFTHESAIRETKKAGKRLPDSWKFYQEMIKKTYEWDCQKFLKKEKIKFCGWRNPNNKTFNRIDDAFYFRCADGSYFYGDKDTWSYSTCYRNVGLSVRCFKD